MGQSPSLSTEVVGKSLVLLGCSLLSSLRVVLQIDCIEGFRRIGLLGDGTSKKNQIFINAGS